MSIQDDLNNPKSQLYKPVNQRFYKVTKNKRYKNEPGKKLHHNLVWKDNDVEELDPIVESFKEKI